MSRSYRPTTSVELERERYRASLVGGQVDRFRVHLVNEKGLAESTAALYAGIVRKFLGEVETLTPTLEQAKAYRDRLLQASRSRAYVGNVVKALRRYSDFSGHDLRLPMVRERHEEVPEYLTEEELRRLLFACRSMKERLVVQLMALAGLRPCEVVGLELADADLKRRVLTVRTTKTRNTWELPLAAELAESVEAYIRYERGAPTTSALLVTPGGGAHSRNVQSINRTVKRLAERAGIAPRGRMRAYTLRHTYATLLTLHGCPLNYVKRLMRHRDLRTTMRYAHVMESGLQEVYNQYAPLANLALSVPSAAASGLQSGPRASR